MVLHNKERRTLRTAPSRSGMRAPTLRMTTTVAANPKSTKPDPGSPMSSA
jgi:hypothetical protein